ncbi:phosphate/phosphite/phosphonate ABC transporter substrate-binding protein [Pontibacter ruber]|uniref:Phosphate/phosphite/phosphonate ABC transporter substrate-binding protein n=1 Tax=Pontibacter ruber TaxID=1343895 RepID=A0ABW5CXZ1_9BACT|nr:phosphate/phosphite/phosphonate ABC transporter substrate-binding protein [Pontibacter ruber]
MKKLQVFFLLSFLLLATAVSGQPASQQKELVFATYTYGDNDRLANIRPMSEYLANKIGASVRLQSFATIKELIEQIRAGNVDVAFVNTFGYLLLQTDPVQSMVPLATLEVPAEKHGLYGSCLVASRKSSIRSTDDLVYNAHKYNITFAGQYSTSGNLLPRLYLNSLGLNNPEEQFNEVHYLNSHANTLLDVKTGNSDLGAFGIMEYYKMLESGQLKEGDVNLIWKSEEIPLGPVVCKTTMPVKDQRKLRKALLKVHKKNPEAVLQIKRAWTEARDADKYVPVTKDYYKYISNLAGNKKDFRRLLQAYIQ